MVLPLLFIKQRDIVNHTNIIIFIHYMILPYEYDMETI
jgi:hypothetical protein